MTEKKMKTIVYSIASAVFFVIAFLVSLLAANESVLYAVCFGLFGGGVGCIIARTVYHLANKDYAVRMWAVSVDILVACLGWLLAVLSTTISWTSVGLAICAFGFVMAHGNRFVKKKKKLISTSEELASSATDSSLISTLRYCYINDDPTLGEDKKRPLCLIDGKAYTCAEAYGMGKGAMAADALQYIQMLTAKINQEEK